MEPAINFFSSPDKPVKKGRVASLFGWTGIACPFLVIGLIAMMRTGFFSFKDDMTGYKALSFFLVSALIIFLAGLTCSAVGCIKKKVCYIHYWHSSEPDTSD